MPVAVKRIYEKPARSDGARVLVDRLWPRGVKKSAAALRKRYLKELSNAEAADALAKLYHFAAGRKKLTLLFAAKNEQRNNAVVLKDLLEGMRKPPTGAGPGAAGKARQPKVMRMRR